ncbi:MAG: hypothetical protein PHP69_01900 [Candidatus Omnitrophica bacterium]|nr:hypothetical protein [Candidatus Omnitrophota bacterium]MDD5080795.1 hypothetical protein [Candidatus Omnitrophota bacterium]MDD5440912.1 hypothetical protein [Candidatus Omnitrophota bacterium]
MFSIKKAITLLEVLIASVLLGVVFSAFFAVINKNNQVFKKTDIAGIQQTDLAYATRFISDEVSNSYSMSVEDSNQTLLLNDADGNPERKFYLVSDSGNFNLMFCEMNASAECIEATKTLLAKNVDVTFKNRVDSSVTVDFDMLSFYVSSKTEWEQEDMEDKPSPTEIKSKLQDIPNMVVVRRLDKSNNFIKDYFTLKDALSEANTDSAGNVLINSEDILLCVGNTVTGIGFEDGVFKENALDIDNKTLTIKGGYGAFDLINTSDIPARDVTNNRTYIDGDGSALFNIDAGPSVITVVFDGILFRKSSSAIAVPDPGSGSNVTVSINQCKFEDNTYDIEINWPDSRLEISDSRFSGQIVKESN